MIEGMVIKGKGVIIQRELQPLMLEQLHRIHMGIEKARPLAGEILILDKCEWY